MCFCIAVKHYKFIRAFNYKDKEDHIHSVSKYLLLVLYLFIMCNKHYWVDFTVY